MGRHSKPPPPRRETLQDELRSVAITPTLKRHRKCWSRPATATTRSEVTTRAEETARDVLTARQQVDEINARQTIARWDAELRSARQITAIAAEAAELLRRAADGNRGEESARDGRVAP
jgi:hypothetical protein